MSPLKQNTTRKKQVDKKVTELEFESGNKKEYKVERIWNSAIYASKAKSHLPSLYNLVEWKKYPEEENIWESSFAVQHLKNLINFFYKKHLEKLIAIFPPINSAPPMAKSKIKSIRPTI